jgi:hypothetical protein
MPKKYITAHSMVNENMTLMVRQLDRLRKRIAIKIYCFTYEENG